MSKQSPARSALTEEQWDTILFNIRSGNCILMLGPEIPTERTKNGRVPLSEILAAQLKKEIGVTSDLANGLFEASQLYLFEKRKQDLLQMKVIEFYSKKKNDKSDIYNQIARIPFPIIIKTTHDFYMENALPVKNSKYYSKRGRQIDVDLTSGPLVYNLFGHIDDPHSLVITENNLLDFLVAVIEKNPPIPLNLSPVLNDTKKSFLFIGFGFQRWYLRLMFHFLSLNNGKQSSFAFEEEFMKGHPHKKETITYYEQGHSLSIFDMNCEKFIKELVRRYNEFFLQRAMLGTPNKAKIFISYREDDKETAKEIWRSLRELGFDPWIDLDKLRIGKCDDQIKKAIDSDADYFLVIQSHNLNSCTECYVKKEIQWALQRVLRIDPKLAFIISIKIDQSELYDPIKEYVMIRPSYFDDKHESLHNLKKMIEADQQLRQEMDENKNTKGDNG